MANPLFQLGPGCLIDQLVGQYMAHACDLGHLLDPAQVRTTLTSILRHNRQEGFRDHVNVKRSYVLGDETGILMATWPNGNRPDSPFPYFTEVMTGFEHQLAVHLIYEGAEDEALRVIRDIRDRYDGAKRNPFDEAECGHHYARALASWGAIIAWTGFHYSAVERRMTFAAREGSWPWSTGDAWGICHIRRADAD